VVLEDGFAKGCEGATVHGMEMNHISCQVARVYGMEMNHISCYMTVILLGTSESCPVGMVMATRQFEGGPRRWLC